MRRHRATARTPLNRLVFSNGCFSKSAELPAAIESTRLEDLVLPQQLAESLTADVSHFLASFLLNELDGFAVNDGLLTIASTNHPERLDPSLLHRPSRFDRKYRFELPELDLRRRYLEAWSAKTISPVSAEVLARAAELSNGFTFAYLKEVGLSTLMQWASEGQKRGLGEVLIEVIEQLKLEILATPAGPPPAPKAKPRFPWDFG